MWSLWGKRPLFLLSFNGLNKLSTTVSHRPGDRRNLSSPFTQMCRVCFASRCKNICKLARLFICFDFWLLRCKRSRPTRTDHLSNILFVAGGHRAIPAHFTSNACFARSRIQYCTVVLYRSENRQGRPRARTNHRHVHPRRHARPAAIRNVPLGKCERALVKEREGEQLKHDVATGGRRRQWRRSTDVCASSPLAVS